MGAIAADRAHEEVKRQWIIPAFAQSASTHALLALTALRLAMAAADGATQLPQHFIDVAMQQRLLAVAAVRRSIEGNHDGPAGSTSNETIAAVYHLICFEETLFLPAFAHLRCDTALAPDEIQLVAHIAGLQQMIGLRGGLQGLTQEQDRTLRSFLIRWVNLPSPPIIFFSLYLYARPTR
jgi:hypothetical protein